MQDLPNGGGEGAPMQALAPGRWRPSLYATVLISHREVISRSGISTGLEMGLFTVFFLMQRLRR